MLTTDDVSRLVPGRRLAAGPLEQLVAVTSAVWGEAQDDAHRWRGRSVDAVNPRAVKMMSNDSRKPPTGRGRT